MSIFSIGEVIRKQRNLLGISQEELANGICSVSTLSRIENGERVPNKANFDALMQRMGQSGEMYDVYIGDNDFEIHEKKFYIRQAVMCGSSENARILLEGLKAIVQNNDTLTIQFIEYMEVLIESAEIKTEAEIKRLETALKMTVPEYGNIKLCNCLLTFDDITIINNIANAYGNINNYRKAINLFYELKEYIDTRYINSEEIMRTYPLLLSNLSKWLGLEGRYAECIEICDLGVKLSSESGRSKLLGKLLYNKAWCIVKRGNIENEHELARTLLQAYYVVTIMNDSATAQKIKEFGLSNCHLLKETFYF